MGLFKKSPPDTRPHPRPDPKLTQPLTPEGFEDVFGVSNDLVRRDLTLGLGGEFRAALFFVDGTASSAWIAENIIRPLTSHPRLTGCRDAGELVKRMNDGVVYNAVCEVRDSMDDAAGDAIRGHAVLILEGLEKAISFEVKGFPLRGVSEPTDENVIKGAKEGFIENIRANTAMVRRKVSTPDLRIEGSVVGRQTQTSVAMVYIQGLTNPDFVDELRGKLDAIDTDAAVMAEEIEEFITDQAGTLCPLTMYTERCDRFCGGIVAGQIGLLVDGLPFGYLMPATLTKLMRAPEDMARQSVSASFVSLIRYISMLISLLLPALYLAIVTFHVEMIPTSLAEAIISIKKGVPFSSFIEITVMLLAFEVLLEAGLRLPKIISGAVSIVGALVVGQAAVEANLLSPMVVIVGATAGICGFTAPNQDFAIGLRLTRLALILCAAVGGMVALTVAFTAVVYRLSMLESFGVPYLAPFSFGRAKEVFQRTVLRPSLHTVKERSEALGAENKRKRR